MAANTFGHSFRITTWGESHGKAIGVVVDGVPAGLEISAGEIQKDLDRRKPGQSAVTTPRSESDSVEILSGVFQGQTTGTPISLVVFNRDADSSAYEKIRNFPRPGHADFTYEEKYGFRDFRGGGRSSARETIGRVAAGAIAKKLLQTKGIEIISHVAKLGGIKANVPDIQAMKGNIEENPIRCADPKAAKEMLEMVKEERVKGDSVGGIVETVVFGVPAGIGEPVFDKLDADIAKAMMGIGAVKGVEIGVGFEAAHMKGSQMNDPFCIEDDKIVACTNHAGGILGGISSGMPIVCRCAVKPTPSISLPQKTVDMEKMTEEEFTITGRHDPTIPPRMVPVAEAMMALVIVDHMIRSGHIHPNKITE